METSVSDNNSHCPPAINSSKTVQNIESKQSEMLDNMQSRTEKQMRWALWLLWLSAWWHFWDNGTEEGMQAGHKVLSDLKRKIKVLGDQDDQIGVWKEGSYSKKDYRNLHKFGWIVNYICTYWDHTKLGKEKPKRKEQLLGNWAEEELPELK